MSILVCTPMYGAQCSELYFHSSLELSRACQLFEIDWLTIGNESLIQRGRNTCAARFLEGDWERLLFIDADIGFSPDDVAALWNADEDIIAGIVPMKKAGTYNAWKDGKMVNPHSEYGGYPLESFPQNTVMEVDYVGTAFIMIKRGVFEAIKTDVARYDEARISGKAWDFFACRVRDEILLSEDYAFLDLARGYGFRANVLPALKLKHAGMTVYA